MTRSFAVAQHEAAHVVVGVALGLRLKRACILPPGGRVVGYAGFDKRCGTAEAFTLMLAAGVAWEEIAAGSWDEARGDLAVLREMGIPTRARVAVLTKAAHALLARLRPVHAQVARALLARDLSGADISTIARGELPEADG
jgi:hypothetical protein